MLVKIVGIQNQSYSLDNGYTFNGRKVHAIDLETSVSGQEGHQVMNFKIPADHKLATVPLKIGAEYILYCDQKGRPDFLQESK